jgi:uncharacterized membrane protein (UPF0127 family)
MPALIGDNPRVRYRWVNASKQDAVVASCAEKAETFMSRFKGLLGRDGLPDGGGLHIEPCNSIHMFFMKFALDIVFLDRELKVVRAIPGIKPWRATRVYSEAESVLELPVGAIAQAGVAPGDVLRVEPVAE